jgi:hypothetical protein
MTENPAYVTVTDVTMPGMFMVTSAPGETDAEAASWPTPKYPNDLESRRPWWSFAGYGAAEYDE